MKKTALFFILLFTGFIPYAQDTIKVMHYNLLFYGLPVYGCNNSNNNPDDKDAYLRTIYAHVRPDIFTVNEMRYENDDSSAVDRILDNVLNIHFNPLYKRANIINLSNSHIINMLYYNAEKLVLYSQDAIDAYRDIHLYTLYYKAADLAQTNDTAFFHCFVTHLKSSQGEDNEAIRAEMTASVMEYLNQHALGGNVLILGDFNVYTAQEEAFQNLINPENQEIAFYDPIETTGNWHNNDAYAHVHTQSTHSTYNDCASSGGMDDRFDFILMDKKIKDYEQHYGYVANSYEALGNDGTCFNQALLLCDNANISDDLEMALYQMSDHLPVVLKLATNQETALSSEAQRSNKTMIYLKNPAKENLRLELVHKLDGDYQIHLFSLMGEMVLRDSVGNRISYIPINHIRDGIYILKIIDPNGSIESRKIVVVK